MLSKKYTDVFLVVVVEIARFAEVEPNQGSFEFGLSALVHQ